MQVVSLREVFNHAAHMKRFDERPRLMRSFIGILSVLIAIAAGAGTIKRVDPNFLLAQIAEQGAASVLKRLWNDSEAFDKVCTAIETADPTWLRVAQRLRPVSDAAAALSLDYSVARAIPKAPERVLALIGNGFNVGDVCTTPFIEPDPGVAERYRREAAAALRKVKKAKLAKVRDQCLAGVMQSMPQ
jgi:hypothetical protein